MMGHEDSLTLHLRLDDREDVGLRSRVVWVGSILAALSRADRLSPMRTPAARRTTIARRLVMDEPWGNPIGVHSHVTV